MSVSAGASCPSTIDGSAVAQSVARFVDSLSLPLVVPSGSSHSSIARSLRSPSSSSFSPRLSSGTLSLSLSLSY